ncbi:unnamed protein product [Rotaria sordida]|uniref:Uncharacterized protein n=1 Tax=Rotaria sordida TaxID=392033 RepID=A0A815QP26_9BILA|nr:unnamed protein product [Rotaria sordida]CAF1163962.1 unnamed protein product [Rotaria sordida]CAF1466016.1 unnamed protein product [Rotaria sordida]
MVRTHFLTYGQGGDIHVFDPKTDQTEHIRCADQCFCLAVHEYHIFIETNRNELEVCFYAHGDSLPSLAHFTQPVSALCLSSSLLFIGTKDSKVVMMNLNDDSNKLKYFDGHQAPILSLNGEYAHIDISEYISKSTSIPLDKEESEVEKMTTISGDDEESESISNHDEEVKEEIIPKWFKYALSMINETKPS